MTYMFQRTDEEAVLSELPPPGDAAQWYNSPEHLTKETNNYPVSQLLGVTDRSVGHVTRSHGRLGAEIATKVSDGDGPKMYTLFFKKLKMLNKYSSGHNCKVFDKRSSSQTAFK